MIQVAAAVIIKDGKCLITRRSPGQNFAGFWEFPGGKLEPGESAPACLRRELYEELSIHISVGELIAESRHEYEFGTIQLAAYRADWLDGDLRLSVHDQIAWVTSNELANYEFLPADVPVLHELSTGRWGC